MRLARAKLLKIVRLRSAVRSLSGELTFGELSSVRPRAGISPVSMALFGGFLNMAVQHHPEEVDLRVEQGIGKAPGDALRGAGRVHDEQDAVKRAPKVRGDEHFTRHRSIQENHVPALTKGPDGPDELRRVREGPQARQ